MSASSSIADGSVFAGRYQVVRCIARGGMGAIYEVIHLETQRRRALKTLLPEVLASKDLQERFRQEARIAAHIESEHLVDVFDAGIDDTTKMPFLVMELLKGEELGDRLERVGRMHPAEVVTYLHQAALALDKTHAANIVHRDLKPDNLFVTQRDDGAPRVKVLDFGIAKVIADGATRSQATRSLGTPLYMAPEQFTSGGRVSAATDIYALALMAYTLLVGQPYFFEDAERDGNIFAFAATVQAGPKEPASVRAARRGVSLPPSFDAWFARTTAHDPKERPQRATTAIAELAIALGTAGPARGPSTSFPSLPPAAPDASPAVAVSPSAAAPTAQPAVTPIAAPHEDPAAPPPTTQRTPPVQPSPAARPAAAMQPHTTPAAHAAAPPATPAQRAAPVAGPPPGHAAQVAAPSAPSPPAFGPAFAPWAQGATPPAYAAQGAPPTDARTTPHGSLPSHAAQPQAPSHGASWPAPAPTHAPTPHRLAPQPPNPQAPTPHAPTPQASPVHAVHLPTPHGYASHGGPVHAQQPPVSAHSAQTQQPPPSAHGSHGNGSHATTAAPFSISGPIPVAPPRGSRAAMALVVGGGLAVTALVVFLVVRGAGSSADPTTPGATSDDRPVSAGAGTSSAVLNTVSSAEPSTDPAASASAPSTDPAASATASSAASAEPGATSSAATTSTTATPATPRPTGKKPTVAPKSSTSVWDRQ